MCGIVGFLELNGERGEGELTQIVTSMTDALIHRGPDAGSVWVNSDERIAVGHRRLSILDLSQAGAQPMHSASLISVAKSFCSAFARVRACKDVRLVILGEGRQHQLLNTLVAELGLQGAVDMPGFVKNPFPYMAKAAMLVLSSKYEGLPGVLIQALACGCPVVSTDCPGGAAEILDNGRYGPLVSVGDVDALARAIDGVLKHPPGKAMLTARSQMFSVDQAASTYLDLLDKLVTAARPASSND